MAEEARALDASDGRQPPFDRGEVRLVLEHARRRFTETCGKDLPLGTGHVRIDFDPRTGAGRLELDRPMPFAADDCVKKIYGAVRIPPFRGEPVTVSAFFFTGPPRAATSREEDESVRSAVWEADFGECRTSDDQPVFPGRLTVAFSPDGFVEEVVGAEDPIVARCVTAKLRASVRLRPIRKDLRVVEAPYRLPPRPIPIEPVVSIGTPILE